MKDKALEFKVGLFAVLGLGLFVAFLFKMDVFYVKSGYTIRALFNYANGLEVGAPVQLAGVPVGNVQQINLQKDEEGRTRIEVTARVRRDVPIDKEADVRINSKTLLGQKYLEILPGPPGNEPVNEGELLFGHDPVMLENITSTGDRVVRKLETSVDALNEIIGDQEFRGKVKDNVVHLNELTNDLKEVAASLKVILVRLEKGEGTIGKLLVDDTVYEEIKLLITDLRSNPWKLLRKDEKKKGGLF